MALSNYDRFITEEFAPNQPEVWESDTFLAYLVEKVPPDQWDEWYAKRVPEEVRASWPGSVVADAAMGHPSPLGGGPTDQQVRRSQRTVARLDSTPRIVRERDRLVASYSSPGEPSLPLYQEAEAIAQRIPVHDVAPEDVSAYLTGYVMQRRHLAEADGEMQSWLRDVPLHIDSARPSVWVNVLPQPVPFTMRPRSIVIEVTCSTAVDLEAVWPTVEDALDRLGRPRRTAGRPVKNAPVYEYAEWLLNFRGLGWKEIMPELDARFPATDGQPREQKLFQDQFYRWRRRRRPAR